MDSRKLYAKRIRHVCSFLSKGGGTLEEMLVWVNRGLRSQQLEEIELRTLQHCIYLLRRGDFEHSRQDDSPDVLKSLFKVQVIGKREYRWGAGSEIPIFGDLDEDERFTLPFLAGILERYRSIPAVEKILDKLPEIFNLREEEMKSSSAIVHSGPVLYDHQQENFQKKVINCVIKILSHIHKSECILFNYTKVKDGVAITRLYEVAPLQIRYYEHYYYLAATNFDGKGITTFRVDQIHRFRIDLVVDDSDQPRVFDRPAFERSTQLYDRFKDSFGGWAHEIDKERLYLVEVEFRGWAAGYARHLKFHPSQDLIRYDPNVEENILVLSFRLRLKPESYPEQPITERNSELAFLLGRFRDYARVISFRLI